MPRLSWSRSRPPAIGGTRSATSRAGSRSSSGRCSTDEIDVAVHSAKDVPAELARRARAGRDPGARGSAGRDLRRSVAGRARRRARASGRAACAARRRSALFAMTWRSSSCAATSTPGCASSPAASATRSCSRSRGCSGWAERTRSVACSTELVPAAGQGALALEARPGAAGGRRARRGSRRARPPRACSPSAS